jgi:hypothetical protein
MASRSTSTGDSGVVPGYEYSKGFRIGKLGFADSLGVKNPRGHAMAWRLSQAVTRAWSDLWYPSFSGRLLLAGFIMVHLLS